MLLLQRLEAPHHGVIFGVGDLGLVLDVVQVLVPAQLLTQMLDLLLNVWFHSVGFLVTVYNCFIITYRNISLIYNPIAGSIRRRSNFPESVLGVLRKGGHAAVAIPTQGPATAAALASSAIEGGADLILAAGGDGTINEVAQGVVGTRVPLGILPGGTANVLCNEMGLGSSMRRAAQTLADCEPRRIAVGRVCAGDGHGQRYFLLMAGVGLDAGIVYRLNLKLKSRLGKLAYWLSGANTFLRFRLAEFRAGLNGGTLATSFALVSRVRNYGGDFEIAPSVHLLDEDFEVVLFEGSNTLKYLPYFTGMVMGRLDRMTGVTIARVSAAEFHSPADERVYVQVDGEFAGRLPARIEIVPDALTLLMPPPFIAKRLTADRRP